MAVVESHLVKVALTEARGSLTDLVGQLEKHPTRAVALTREEETAAVLLHPAAFGALVAAAGEADDLNEAEEALANEPLEGFAEYHARRLAGRQRTGR